MFRYKNSQSNVIAGEIISRILKIYGFEPQVFRFGRTELEDAVEQNPFKTDDGKVLHFFFLDSHPENINLERLTALNQNQKNSN